METAGAEIEGRVKTRPDWRALGLLTPATAFLGFVLIYPLVHLLSLSFADPAGAMTPYIDLLTSDVYQIVFRNTLAVAATVTVLCVVLAYPLAFALTRMTPRWRALALGCVLFPLWISVLVRTFSWMLLLERNGPINRGLIELGVITQPMSLLFNQTGVLIGMVHVLLPYAVLPIYASIIRIDPGLLLASDGLGASVATTFRRVLLPLSMPGVLAGATFTFLLSLGFFITPALLGGSGSTTLSMLIETLVNERLAWPLASAAGFILLVTTLLLLAIAARLAPISQMAAIR
jgi:ABC-type spermidine/putrescine transport system permease subunit I